MRSWIKIAGTQVGAVVLCAGLQAQQAPVNPPPIPGQTAPAQTAPASPAAATTPGSASRGQSAAKVAGDTTAATPNSATGAPLPGEALDRVVAVVNHDLVLESDVDEERRMAVLQPVRDPSGHFSREQAIERLIDRDLILQQAKIQAVSSVSDEQVQAELSTLRKEIPACKQYHCDTAAGWAQFLKANGLSEAEVDRLWSERIEVLQYIEVRFRSGVRIQPDQIKTYYEKNMLPEYQKRGVQPPPLDSVSHQIEEVLLQQQVTSLLQDWLKSLRAQGSVVMMKPGEMAP